ncbi:hypothetical protein EV379_2201 [Microterricola gilva]|uniref:Uncharacterized protein n=1 Tax=Microterricola gilva TaxID=393267 RepID=A0A4Q8AP76_9MICO|nr:hypothetical protein [Microterricola gilva]RZU65863.1 hypothetical protein EV379_2201 [Microterricola gilva]
MGRIRVFGLAAVLLLSLAVPGCAEACPAIGWINAVNIELDGHVDDVAAVELCFDGVCSEAAPFVRLTDVPLHVATALPEDDPTAASTAESLLFSTERINERTWRITFPTQAPDSLTVRAVSAAGEVLAEGDATLEWQRVGGSERCGGPLEGAPIGLDIPS